MYAPSISDYIVDLVYDSVTMSETTLIFPMLPIICLVFISTQLNRQ